jgi:hypothetical protein
METKTTDGIMNIRWAFKPMYDVTAAYAIRHTQLMNRHKGRKIM